MCSPSRERRASISARIMRNPALEGFGDDEILLIRERMAPLDPFFSREHDVRATAVLSRTQLLPRDENGRVRLPDEIIAHAGLKDRILFVASAASFRSGMPNAIARSKRKTSNAPSRSTKRKVAHEHASACDARRSARRAQPARRRALHRWHLRRRRLCARDPRSRRLPRARHRPRPRCDRARPGAGGAVRWTFERWSTAISRRWIR